MKLLKSSGQTKKLLMKLVMDEINLNKETRHLHKMIVMSRQYEFLRKRLVSVLNNASPLPLASRISMN